MERKVGCTLKKSAAISRKRVARSCFPKIHLTYRKAILIIILLQENICYPALLCCLIIQNVFYNFKICIKWLAVASLDSFSTNSNCSDIWCQRFVESDVDVIRFGNVVHLSVRFNSSSNPFQSITSCIQYMFATKSTKTISLCEVHENIHSIFHYNRWTIDSICTKGVTYIW